MEEEDVIKQFRQFDPMKKSVDNALAHEKRLPEKDRKEIKESVKRLVYGLDNDDKSKRDLLLKMRSTLEDMGLPQKDAEDVLMMHAQATAICGDIAKVVGLFEGREEILAAVNVMSYWSMLSLLDKRGLLSNTN